MTEAEITELVSTQRNYFKTGETLSVAYRIAALKKLKNTMTVFLRESRQNPFLFLTETVRSLREVICQKRWTQGNLWSFPPAKS